MHPDGHQRPSARIASRCAVPRICRCGPAVADRRVAIEDNLILLVFDRNLNEASAENTANYSLSSFGTVNSATLEGGAPSRFVILNVTNGLSDGDIEDVTAENVISSSGLPMPSAQSRTFANGVCAAPRSSSRARPVSSKHRATIARASRPRRAVRRPGSPIRASASRCWSPSLPGGRDHACRLAAFGAAGVRAADPDDGRPPLPGGRSGLGVRRHQHADRQRPHRGRQRRVPGGRGGGHDSHPASPDRPRAGGSACDATQSVPAPGEDYEGTAGEGRLRARCRRARVGRELLRRRPEPDVSSTRS